MKSRIFKKNKLDDRSEEEALLAWQLMGPADENDKGLWVSMPTGELPGFGSHIPCPPFNAPFANS